MLLKTQSLIPVIRQILLNKATEAPFTGEYTDLDQPGSYLCRLCGLALFRANSKFHSGCGWPSFDQALPGTVLRLPDPDGRRTEIVCAQCQGHLGHVFEGEQFTRHNTRHCVNSLSLDHVDDNTVTQTEEAIFAGGCFWGIEYLFKKLPGVLKAESGYIGGDLDYPTYEQICTGRTGHYEAVRVLIDPSKINFEQLTQYFFEIHDPEQQNGQGPDLGPQYLSAIFYYDPAQAKTAQAVIEQLTAKGYHIATQVRPMRIFWPAEAYHQHYYDKTGKQPYCHRHIKKF